MAIRKIETVGSLEELGLSGDLLQSLTDAGVTAKDLVLAARNDIAWRSYLPDKVWVRNESTGESWPYNEANHLMQIPGVGEKNYVKIMVLVIQAGFIIYEGELSRKVRQIGAKNGGIDQFLDNYEELEDLFPLDQ